MNETINTIKNFYPFTLTDKIDRNKQTDFLDISIYSDSNFIN